MATTRARAPSTATVISARRRSSSSTRAGPASRARIPESAAAASRACVSGLFSAAESGPRSPPAQSPAAPAASAGATAASRTRRDARGGRPSAERGKELLRLASPRVLRVPHDELLERGAGAVLLVHGGRGVRELQERVDLVLRARVPVDERLVAARGAGPALALEVELGDVPLPLRQPVVGLGEELLGVREPPRLRVLLDEGLEGSRRALRLALVL